MSALLPASPAMPSPFSPVLLCLLYLVDYTYAYIPVKAFLISRIMPLLPQISFPLRRVLQSHLLHHGKVKKPHSDRRKGSVGFLHLLYPGSSIILRITFHTFSTPSPSHILPPSPASLLPSYQPASSYFTAFTKNPVASQVCLLHISSHIVANKTHFLALLLAYDMLKSPYTIWDSCGFPLAQLVSSIWRVVIRIFAVTVRTQPCSSQASDLHFLNSNSTTI